MHSMMKKDYRWRRRTLSICLYWLPKNFKNDLFGSVYFVSFRQKSSMETSDFLISGLSRGKQREMQNIVTFNHGDVLLLDTRMVSDWKSNFWVFVLMENSWVTEDLRLRRRLWLSRHQRAVWYRCHPFEESSQNLFENFLRTELVHPRCKPPFAPL